jgi:nicotinamide mononucleotide transporter
MRVVIDWLHAPAFHVVGTAVSWAEVLGDLTGAASVWWAARQNVLTWPVGIVNSALFLVLFVDAKLYADSVLQVAFVVLGFYGGWRWLRGTEQGDDLPVRRATGREWAILLAVVGVAQAAWTYWLARHTDSPAPFWDASVLVLSLGATWAQAKKLLESWVIWITVDVISVPLYLSRELVPTALLYGIFGVMCVVGLRDWRRSFQESSAAPGPIGAEAEALA